MAPKLPNQDQIIRGVVVGLIILYILTQIINFSAINSDDPDAMVFKEDLGYQTVKDSYVAILVGIAVILTWRFAMYETFGRWDRKRFITILFVGIIIYFLYTKILAPNLGLPDLSFAAYQLQAISPPGLQAILG